MTKTIHAPGLAGAAVGVEMNATQLGGTGPDSLLINPMAVGLRSYIVTDMVPGSRASTNVVTTVSIGEPVNLALSNVVVISREQITALVPAGGGTGTGTVNVVSSPTNGAISFGKFINQ